MALWRLWAAHLPRRLEIWVAGKGPGNSYARPSMIAANEQYRLEQPHLYQSALNNPLMPFGSNYGGQDGDRAYPIHYNYGRYNAGRGRMHDTRDFFNHCHDGRSNDYVPRAVPDPSTIGKFKMAMGGKQINRNGTVNAFNPPEVVHGLPPKFDSSYYFLQT